MFFLLKNYIKSKVIVTDIDEIVINREYFFDLQLFAKAEDEGRTEDPTEYKKRKARQDEGKVVKSQEIVSAIVLIGGFLVIWLMGNYIFDQFSNLFKDSYSNLSDYTISGKSIFDSLLWLLIIVLKIAGPIFAVALIFAVLANVAQFGFMFVPKLIKLDIKKIAPKFNRIIGTQAKQNLVKSIGKVVIIAGTAFIIITSRIDSIMNTIFMSTKRGLSTILNAAFLIIILVGLILAIFSIIDYIWQKKTYTEQLKMSRHEVKEELKDTEMDPNVKRRLREKHNELIRMKTIEEKVPEADVIVRNPDHYAVALKFDPEVSNRNQTPFVLAKGVNRQALKIIEIGEKNNIYIHEDKELAQDLYSITNEGEEIPEDFGELLTAVANIFNIFYSKYPARRPDRYKNA